MGRPRHAPSRQRGQRDGKPRASAPIGSRGQSSVPTRGRDEGRFEAQAQEAEWSRNKTRHLLEDAAELLRRCLTTTTTHLALKGRTAAEMITFKGIARRK